LWRAVTSAELADIHGTRSFGSTQGVKFFSYTEHGAAEYARRSYAFRGEKDGPYTMIRSVTNKAYIPASAQMPHTSDVVDGGVALEDDVLPKLGRPQIVTGMSTGVGCP